MEAKLRYQKDLQTGGLLSRPKKVSKNVNTASKQATQAKQPAKQQTKKNEEPPKTNKVDITHSAPQEIPNAYGPPRIDFIQRNIEQASNQRSRAKKEVVNRKEKIVSQKHAPGEIPHYYSKRAAENVSKNNESVELQCPPGMRLLSEKEKQEAIQDLTEQRDEILSTLGRAPLRIESPQLQRQQRILEQQLTDIESSLEQLKKKYVFVPE